MKLFLIRHAETVHNVGQAWAGTTDSPLTNHGVLQIQRLAQHFSSSAVRFKHVFSSDLQRAVITAEGICDKQPGRVVSVVTTPTLQEQHFGSREGVAIRRQQQQQQQASVTAHRQTDADATIPAETEDSMRARANTFLSQYLLPALLLSIDNEGKEEKEEEAIAIVAHGIILRVLWNCLVQTLSPRSSSVHYRVPEVAPFWSNTGYMEVSIHRRDNDASLLPSEWSITVLAVDSKPHLRDLRRTGGGIGSSQHDTRQRSIRSFFKP